MKAVKIGLPLTNSNALKSSLDWEVWSLKRYRDRGAAILSVEAVIVCLVGKDLAVSLL